MAQVAKVQFQSIEYLCLANGSLGSMEDIEILSGEVEV